MTEDFTARDDHFRDFVRQELQDNHEHAGVQALMGTAFLNYHTSWPYKAQMHGMFAPGFTSKARALQLPLGHLEIMDVLLHELTDELDENRARCWTGRRGTARNVKQYHKAQELMRFCRFWLLIFLAQPLSKEVDMEACERMGALLKEAHKAFTLGADPEATGSWYDRMRGGFNHLTDMQSSLHKAVSSIKQ